MSAPEVRQAIQWLWWLNVAKTIGAGLVAIGVAAEFIGECASRQFEGVVSGARQAEITRLTAEAAAARSAGAGQIVVPACHRVTGSQGSGEVAAAPSGLDPARDGGMATRRRSEEAEPGESRS